MANKPNIVKAIGNQLGTTLASGINASDTSITVSDGAGFSSDGGYIIIDENVAGKEEIAYVESASGATLTIATDGRGRAGTSASVHDAGATVSDILVDEHINGIAEEFRIEHDDNGGHTGLDDGIVLSGSAVSTSNKVVDASGDNTVSGTALSSTNLIVDQAGNYHSMARQAIMNGNFDIWQRGTTGTISDGVALPVADRWYDWHVKDGGTLPTLTRSRTYSTTIPNFGYQYVSRLTTNGAGSSLGNDARGYYYHKIENGTRIFGGADRTVTVSFWARSDIANKRLGVWLIQDYGTGGSPTTQEIITGEDFTLSGGSAWTYITKTFTLNTLSGKTFGTDDNDVLIVYIQYMWGSTYGGLRGLTTSETYGGSGTIDIAQVQLNAGEVALPFYPKTFEQEYKDCQRYFQKSFNYNTAPANGVNYLGSANRVTDRTGSYQGLEVIFQTKMRGTPTIALYSPYIATANRIVDVNNCANNYAAYARGVSENGFCIETSSSITSSTLICCHWTADADLA